MAKPVAAEPVDGRARARAVRHPDLVALVDERRPRQRQQEDRGQPRVGGPEPAHQAREVVVGEDPGRAPERGARLDDPREPHRVPLGEQELEGEGQVEVLEVRRQLVVRHVDLADQHPLARCFANRGQRLPHPRTLLGVDVIEAGGVRMKRQRERRGRPGGRREGRGPWRGPARHRPGSHRRRGRARTARRRPWPRAPQDWPSPGRAVRDRSCGGTTGRSAHRGSRRARRRRRPSCWAGHHRPTRTSPGARGTRGARSTCGWARGRTARAGRGRVRRRSARRRPRASPGRGRRR